MLVGAQLGAYQVIAKLGEGGMGQVYKARDTRLDRIVAIKVLPERFADDASRRERFEREARAVAALNHPHICQLYDVGEAAESPSAAPQRFLVMEYLEGQSLEDRLVSGALPMAEALRIAIDLADALDHAHQRGLVHRDIKPANVMLTRGGAGTTAAPQAKLLDFGISRLQAPADLPALETVTEDRAPLTAEGAVLGTYPYMAPEQLQGREADARSDLFSFGAVLYEMITGTRAFQGTTAATLIGAILHSNPPPLAGREPPPPPALDRIVSRCLAKDPGNRWQTARDLALELRWIVEHPAEATGEGPRRWARSGMIAAAVLAAVLAIAVAASTGAFLRAEPEAAPIVRLAFDPAGETGSTQTIGPVIVSPDGRLLVYALDRDGRQQLWLRALDALEARPLADTDGGAYPFWSPDSRWIAFFAHRKLKRIAVDRGPAQILSDAREPRGGAWSTAGEILFTANAGRELYRIPAGGGVPTPLPADGLNLERLQPSFLPDGRHFVYAGRNEKPGVFLGSLDRPEVTALLEDYSAVAYVPPGYLLLLRGAAQNANVQTLLAQRFDAASRTLVGTPEPLADEINFETRLGLGYFSASAIGTLVYGNPEWRATRLTWFDRSGAVVGQVESTGDFSQPALSPNDATIVAQRVDPVSGVSDLWSIDAASGLGQRLTHGNFGSMPLWSPDGTQIVFSSARDRFPPNLFLATMSASGKEERLVESGDLHHPTDWSRDGRFVIYAAQRSGTTGWDLMKLPMTGPAEGRRPETIRDTAFDEHFGRLSPDGRWLAYASDESGTFEVYVRPFPRDGAPHRVSLNGGMEPLWRRDGSELFYVTPAGVLMTASVNAGASAFSRAGPMPLFPTQATPRIVRRARFLPTYRVSSDGRRFLLAVAAGEARTSPTKITFNWPSALTRP